MHYALSRELVDGQADDANPDEGQRRCQPKPHDRRGANDRRTVAISLTPEGRTRLRRKRRELRQRRERLYRRLEPDEREQSEHLLRHLAELLVEL